MWRRTRFVLNGVAFLFVFVKDVLDFQIHGIAVIFCIQLWGNSENTKNTKRLNKDEIEKQLIDSITISNVVEVDDLNEKTERAEKPEDPADIIKQYEEILGTKRKGIISVAYYQGKVFKQFKEKETFIQMVGKLRIHSSTIIFKINIFKLIDKHPELMNSSEKLGFLDNYCKDIKQMCEENSSEFE